MEYTKSIHTKDCPKIQMPVGHLIKAARSLE